MPSFNPIAALMCNRKQNTLSTANEYFRSPTSVALIGEIILKKVTWAAFSEREWLFKGVILKNMSYYSTILKKKDIILMLQVVRLLVWLGVNGKEECGQTSERSPHNVYHTCISGFNGVRTTIILKPWELFSSHSTSVIVA